MYTHVQPLYTYTVHGRVLTCQDPEKENHDECVAKVEEVGEGTSDGSLVHKVVHREKEEVESSGACRRKKGRGITAGSTGGSGDG